jgi:MFS family permease
MDNSKGKDNPINFRKIINFIFCTIFFMSYITYRCGWGTIRPSLVRDVLGGSGKTYGTIVAVWGACYAIMQIFAGFLVNKYGIMATTLGAFLSSLLPLITGLYPNYWSVCITMSLSGIPLAFATTGFMNAAKDLGKYFSVAANTGVTFAMITASIINLLISKRIDVLKWTFIPFFISGIMFACFLGLLIFCKNPERDDNNENSNISFKEGLVAFLSNPFLILLGVFGFLSNCAQLFQNGYFTSIHPKAFFLPLIGELDPTFLFNIGASICSILFIYPIEKFKQVNISIFLSVAQVLSVIVSLIYIKNPVIIGICAFVFGLSCQAHSFVMQLAGMIPKYAKYASFYIGLINFIDMIGTSTAQYTAGCLSDIFKDNVVKYLLIFILLTSIMSLLVISYMKYKYEDTDIKEAY